MNDKLYLKNLLSDPGKAPEDQLELFALINLGILESLSNGLINASDALRTFYHAENSMFVRKQLGDEITDEIMSHGVQLSDLFQVLPPEEAQREFQYELRKMHSLCLSLLEKKFVAA